MADLVTVRNDSKQPVELVLDHPAFLTPSNGWRRSTATFANSSSSGNRTVSEVRRSYPGVLRLLPGEAALTHPAIVKCLQVADLIKRRVLTVTAAPAIQEETDNS